MCTFDNIIKINFILYNVYKYTCIQVYLYTSNNIIILGEKMTTTIRLNENIKELLKLKSAETGISQLELANKYILKGLKEDTTPKKEVMSLEEIEKLLDHDKVNGDNILDELDSAVHSDIKTNAVELKKQAHRNNYDFFR